MKLGRTILWAFLGIIVLASISGMALMTRSSEGKLNWKTHDESEAEAMRLKADQDAAAAVPEAKESGEGKVIAPEIDQQLLTVNKWSRPGTKTKQIKYVVIHYLGNPGTTAQENRDYFESLKDLQNTSMSANYIVGLDGEVIECIPDGEIAYASNSANKESVSIENCNIDSSGKFLQDTYISLVKLTAFLAEKYGLDRDGIIRHHDVTGKDCPVYYVENEEAWETFLDDVMLYIDLCAENSGDLDHLDTVLEGVKFTYKSKFDGDIIVEKDENREVGRPHDYEDANEDYGEEYDDYYSESHSSSENVQNSSEESHNYSDDSYDYSEEYTESYNQSYNQSYNENNNESQNHYQDQSYTQETDPVHETNVDNGTVVEQMTEAVAPEAPVPDVTETDAPEPEPEPEVSEPVPEEGEGDFEEAAGLEDIFIDEVVAE